MSTVQMNAEIALIDDKVKMEALIPGKLPLTMDYVPPLGRGEGYTPLELLMVSLGTCYGTTLKFILAGQLQKDIRGLTVRVEADRATAHPTKFDTIRLILNVDSPDLTMEILTAAAALAEEKYCPVWAMIKGNASIETKLTITNQTAASNCLLPSAS